MDRLPLETQTLYAELMEQLQAYEARRSIGKVPGSFVTKTVKGVVYYYFQYSQPGGRSKQSYLGRKTPEFDRVVERFQSERDAFQADKESIQRLCALLRTGGALVTDTASGRVLQSLADSGIFHLDGILVGTHTFVVLGNLLGVRWDGASLRTHDIDIAGETRMAVAVPQGPVDLPGVLEGMEIGFLPVPPFDPKEPSTSFKVRGRPLRVDLLTPSQRRTDKGPVAIPRFRAAAQPLPFLDFLLKDPVKGAVINGGGVLVNVPFPARFAFHKLIVAGERNVSEHGKREKDFLQSSQVFEVLLDERPGDLSIVWEDITERGDKWIKRIRTGVKQLRERFPETGDRLLDDFLK